MGVEERCEENETGLCAWLTTWVKLRKKKSSLTALARLPWKVVGHWKRDPASSGAYVARSLTRSMTADTTKGVSVAARIFWEAAGVKVVLLFQISSGMTSPAACSNTGVIRLLCCTGVIRLSMMSIELSQSTSLDFPGKLLNYSVVFVTTQLWIHLFVTLKDQVNLIIIMSI